MGYKPKCEVDWDTWAGNFGYSFATGEENQIKEITYFHRVGKDRWCSRGKLSKLNCYKQEGRYLYNEKIDVRGELLPNGDLKWTGKYIKDSRQRSIWPRSFTTRINS